MKRIGDFTAKYGTVESNTRSSVHIVQKAIEQIIEVQIASKGIKINDGIVYIQTHPAIKQVMLSEKKKIIELIKSFGVKVSEIR